MLPVAGGVVRGPTCGATPASLTPKLCPLPLARSLQPSLTPPPPLPRAASPGATAAPPRAPRAAPSSPGCAQRAPPPRTRPTRGRACRTSPRGRSRRARGRSASTPRPTARTVRRRPCAGARAAQAEEEAGGRCVLRVSPAAAFVLIPFAHCPFPFPSSAPSSQQRLWPRAAVPGGFCRVPDGHRRHCFARARVPVSERHPAQRRAQRRGALLLPRRAQLHARRQRVRRRSALRLRPHELQHGRRGRLALASERKHVRLGVPDRCGGGLVPTPTPNPPTLPASLLQSPCAGACRSARLLEPDRAPRTPLCPLFLHPADVPPGAVSNGAGGLCFAQRARAAPLCPTRPRLRRFSHHCALGPQPRLHSPSNLLPLARLRRTSVTAAPTCAAPTTRASTITPRVPRSASHVCLLKTDSLHRSRAVERPSWCIAL